jgi:hypothetical protein
MTHTTDLIAPETIPALAGPPGGIAVVHADE